MHMADVMYLFLMFTGAGSDWLIEVGGGIAGPVFCAVDHPPSDSAIAESAHRPGFPTPRVSFPVNLTRWNERRS